MYPTSPLYTATTGVVTKWIKFPLPATCAVDAVICARPGWRLVRRRQVHAQQGGPDIADFSQSLVETRLVREARKPRGR